VSTGTSKTDLTVSGIKGVLGTIPIVGPLLAEVVGVFIPNQRVDRIAKFAHELGERLKELDQHVLGARLASPGYVDLLEDGFWQAARAVTEERIKHIASVVSNGLSGEEKDLIQVKKLLWLLAELNDAEVIVLRSHLFGQNQDPEFSRRHAAVLYAPAATVGMPAEVLNEALDKGALVESFRQHLQRLGLVRPVFIVHHDEIPEFDRETGMIRAIYHDITHLGKMLLRYIDLDQPLSETSGQSAP
jgi:hypothetical protein